VSIDARSSVTLASFLRQGLRVVARCTGVQRGIVRLRLRGTTLAERSVQCDRTGRAVVRIKLGAAAKRALRRARGSLRVTVSLEMGSARSSRRLALRR